MLLSAALLGTLARFEMSYGCPLRRPKVRSGARFLAHICRGVVTTEVADPNAFACLLPLCVCCVYRKRIEARKTKVTSFYFDAAELGLYWNFGSKADPKARK